MRDEIDSYREESLNYEDLEEMPPGQVGDEAHNVNAGNKARGK